MDVDTGQDKYSHDGVLLRKASREHNHEFNTTGCLNLIEFNNPLENIENGENNGMSTLKRSYAIEWRPNDGFLISSTDTQEQDEWSFVDTIAKRNRTTSECLIFDTATNNISVKSQAPANGSNGSNNNGSSNDTKPSNGATTSSVAAIKRNRNIRVNMNDLKRVEVQRGGHVVRLITPDGKVHSDYLFQHGNADNFVRSLRRYCLLSRSGSDRLGTVVYDVTADEANETQEKLKKTFAELDIDEIKSPSTGWISNMVLRPIDMLAKIANNYNIHATQNNSPSSSPTSGTSPVASPRTSSVSMFQSTAGEDYELLSTSPRVTGLINDDQRGNRMGTAGEVSNVAKAEERNRKLVEEAPKRKLPERIIRPRGQPLSREEWCKCFGEDGSVSDSMMESVKKKIFEGGVQEEIRAEVWKFLLDYDRWDQTTRQRELRRAQKNSEYYIMKSQWLRMSTVQEDNFSDYRDRKCQIQKDVKRTDRTHEFFAGDENPNLETLYEILMTYVMYNFDLGYVQGMSDLLAPLLYIMRNERDAFWCFVGFMERVVRNFDIDQAGMKNQLQNLNKLLAFVNPRLADHLKATGSDNMFFCFRWLLVWFKREFSQDDIMTLWEVLWTGRPCVNYHLMVCVAVLDEQAQVIVDRNYEFTEVLKHVNELSLQLDLKRILANAEAIYYQVINAAHLTDEITQILGMEVAGEGEGEREGAGFNEIGGEMNGDDEIDQMKVASPVKSFEEEERMQKKIEEALEQSMYLGYF